MLARVSCVLVTLLFNTLQLNILYNFCPKFRYVSELIPMRTHPNSAIIRQYYDVLIIRNKQYRFKFFANYVLACSY